MRKILVLLSFLVFVSIFNSPVWSASTSSSDSIGTTNYELPYPGILPDSPLYFIKVARDRMISVLIQSPVKKSFYALLLSDKRLAAGQVLVDTGKTNLGVTTIVNGEDYFSEAVSLAEEAKKQKRDTSELWVKLSVAAVKHDEIISRLMPKVSGMEESRLESAYENSQKSRKRVQEMMKNGR